MIGPHDYNPFQPPVGRVSAVHNTPGSPYATSNPLSYDVQYDTPSGPIIDTFARPFNKYPTRYDVHGAVPGTPVSIAWIGGRAHYNIPWSEDVTTDCEGEP